MIQLIADWILNSVRCYVSTLEELGKACFDGKVFAQILVTYNVCSSEYVKLISATDSRRGALSNLKKLCVWFKLLGISITDEFLNEIANQNGSASLRLLYELYIRLENQEVMLYMDNKKMQRILSESTDKFHVNRVGELDIKPKAVDDKQYLRDLLKSYRGIMESSENKNLKLFIANGIKRRAEVVKNRIIKSEFPPYKCYDHTPSFPHLDVQAKIKEFEIMMESPEGRENRSEAYHCEPDEYISYLRLKKRRAESDKKLKLRLEKSSMEDAWKKILQDQELELKNLLSLKLLKQSDYEKQMTLRLKRQRLKYQKFIDTKNMIMNIAEKQEIVGRFRSSFTGINVQQRSEIEKQRIKELHERLFKEKMDIKKKLDVEACRRILEDIVDFAMLSSDYVEQNGMPMPRNKKLELKFLFIKGVRLLPHDIFPVLIRDPYDEPIFLDEERLIELAEYEFYLYMNRLGPWCFSKKPEEEDEEEQLNITGFIVHRLLDLKYDFSLCAGDPADLPQYSYKVFLHRINDTYVLDKLKNYLSKFRIEVIDIFQVINYFLNFYKIYLGVDVLKESAKNSNPARNMIGSAPAHRSNVNKNKFRPWTTMSEKPKEKHADKVVQVPSDDMLVKEKNATTKLGKFIYDILITGQLLPDSFLCYLVIEYLKSLKDIDGWVLINYPENITQLAILEFMFSGLEVPFMPKITQNIRKLIESQLTDAMPESTSVIEHPSLYEDKSMEYECIEQFSVEELLELKNSNILPRPNPPPKPLEFKSFFTRVIILLHEGEHKKGSRKMTKSESKPIEHEENTGEKITLESFYTSQNIRTNFAYKNFDPATLKKLLTFILNMSATEQNEFLKNFEKGLDVTVKPAKDVIVQSPPKALKFKRNALDDWVLRTFLEGEEGLGLEESGMEEEVADEIIIYPGHKDWEYTEMVLPEFYVKALATVWESVEYFFTRNLKKCFALLKTVETRLMPYRNYIRRKADECLTMDDDRTEAVTNFQLMLNKINDHYRPLDSMKNELHHRILKLQCDLWKMTDVKKFYCEQVFQMISNQNWLSHHMTNLLQVYRIILQVEMDRFADTMQLIEDYYAVSLTGQIFEDRLTKIVLPKIKLKHEKKDELFSKPSRFQIYSNPTKKAKAIDDKQSKNAFDFDSSKVYFCYTDYETSECPALSLLKALITKMTKNVLQMKNHCLNRSNSITDKLKESSRQRVMNERKISSPFRDSPMQKHLLNVSSEMYNSMINKISLEWEFAIDYETKRALYRIHLIEKRASADIMEDMSIIEDTFKEFQQGIVNLYHNQIVNIDKVCDLLRAAVEEEVKIQPMIVLKQDALEIDGSIILFPNPPPPPPSPLQETATGFRFTISQLTNLFYKLVYVAPYGIIEQTFVLILEDMAVIGHETGHSYLPPCWSDFSSDRIKDIVHRLYGEKVIIDWRLFIIFGLDLGYPTVENILEMRNSFRLIDTNLTETVNYEQYCCVFLWFENNETFSINQDLYIAKAKELLFKLFQFNNENLMNYTEFLLAFCRDYDPREGFVKALALAEGCATISWKQDLFKETIQIEKENEKYNVAYGVMTIIMAGVYRIVDSVIITDLKEDSITISKSSSGIISRKKSARYTLRKKKSNFSTSDESSEYATREDAPFIGSSSEAEESIVEPNPFEKDECHVLWKSDVYFSTVFSLLMLEIHQFALSANHIYEPIRLEEKLLRIYQEKGKDFTIKLYDLLNDTEIQKIFTSYRCFQAFNLPQLLMKITKDDFSNVHEHKLN